MNQKIAVIRRLEFDAAHRVLNHESKCATLHGHRYAIEVEAVADRLDAIGRVIDFSVLKQRIGSWIDREWDHTTLVSRDDTRTLMGLEMIPSFKPPFICDFNPTAENIAEFLLKVVCPAELGDTGVTVTRIRVWETPNCSAEARL